MKSLLIVGAGGQGKVVCEIAQLMKQWDSIAFLDDSKDNCLGFKVIGGFNDFEKFSKVFDDLFIAIGDNKTRMNFLYRGYSLYKEIPTLIHPSAIISPYSKLQQGTVVMANAVINPCAQIGSGCIINTGAIIEHDCIIKEGVHISPGCSISGNVQIDAFSWIGSGSSVKNGIHIAENAICGSGSNVICDVNADEVVVGNPAYVLRRQCDE